MQTASRRCYIWQTSEPEIDWKQIDFILSPVAKRGEGDDWLTGRRTQIGGTFWFGCGKWKTVRNGWVAVLEWPPKWSHPAELSAPVIAHPSFCMSNMNVSSQQQVQSAIWIALVLYECRWREHAAADNLEHSVSWSWRFSISISRDLLEISEMKN